MNIKTNTATILFDFVSLLSGCGRFHYTDVFTEQAFGLIKKFYNNFNVNNVWSLNLYDDCISFVETMENTIEIPWSEIKFTQEQFIEYVLGHDEYYKHNDFRMQKGKTNKMISNHDLTATNSVAITHSYADNCNTLTHYGDLAFPASTVTVPATSVYSNMQVKGTATSSANDTINIKIEKEENNMFNLNFDFGPIGNNSNVAYSMYGMAIKNAENKWVCLRDGDIVDVTGFLFNDMNQFMYKMPVAIKDIAPGDIIIHNKKPCFVQSFAKDSGNPVVIDIYNGEEKTILPAKNMFGFDFVTKVVCFFNMDTGKADAENPFGNLMPLMMMQAFSNSKENDMGKFFMMSMMMNGKNPFELFRK